MRRVIGMDIHRTFAEVAFWEEGRLRPMGRVSMTRSGLESFGRSLSKEDEVVIEATGNATAVVRVLSPCVAHDRGQSLAGQGDCACARQDGQDRCGCAGVPAGSQFLARGLVAGFGYRTPAPIGGTPQSGCPAPHADQNEVHSILHTHLVPPCPHCRPIRATGSDLVGETGHAG